MTWLLVIAAAWLVVALILGAILGHAIRHADRRDEARIRPLPHWIEMHGNTVHDPSAVDAGTDDDGRHRAVG